MGTAKVEVRTSSIQGNGGFAIVPIKKGEIVHFMQGREVGWWKCFFLVLTKQVQIDMPFQMTNNSFLLLDELSIALNHSCNPCCAVIGKNQIIARRDIAIGEEITYDYSATVLPGFFTKNWLMECRCGAENCRKEVKNADFIPENQLIDYIKHNQLPDFIREYFQKKRPDLFL